MTTVQSALLQSAERLGKAGVDDGKGDAKRLLAHVLNVSAARLSMMSDEVLDLDAEAFFEEAIWRRTKREPMSHITGQRAFWKHTFKVTPDVLDPRPDTETLVATALELPFKSVLDIGTGSGAILISLLADRPDATGIGSDLSLDALDVADENAKAIGVKDRAGWIVSDVFEDIIAEPFDLIVSNPPYIAEQEMPDLSPEVLHEPHMALSDGADGLMIYRSIAAQARPFLKNAGKLIVEIGYMQSLDVVAIFQAEGFQFDRLVKDIDGRDRVLQFS